MERKIKLQENYSLADTTFGWIGSHLNGKSIMVLHWINTGLKFKKRPTYDFKIKWAYIATQLGTERSNVAREVRNLVKKGVLVKLQSGLYTWDKTGIHDLINRVPEVKKQVRKPKVKETINQEPVVFRPVQGNYNEMGLLIDESGNVIY